MEKIGKLMLSNQKVEDKDIEELFSSIWEKNSGDNKGDGAEKSDKEKWDLLEIRRQWKILADLWINSSGPKEIHIGRQLIYFLRTEVMTYVQNSLPWRELEFLVTMFLLRQQRRLSDEEIILCDLSISRMFLKNCVSDFTEQFEKLERPNVTKGKNYKTRSEYINSFRESNYPRIDEIMDKFTHLRRFRSLIQIREVLQELHQPSADENNKNESYFLCIAKITELLHNTVASPHFPPLDEVSIENMLMPVEISTPIIQRSRYVFGHMVSLKTNDSFAKLTPIFKTLEPIINVLLENEKRVVVMKFLNKVLNMEIVEFQNEVEQFDEHNVPWFELDDSKNKAHTDLLDKLIKNWEGLKKEYKNIKPQIVETGSLEYISEMLKSFRNLYEIMGNEFNDRINPLLIKIANFKLAKDDSTKEAILQNIKTSMNGYKNWYRYQKSLNIQQRITSVLFIMKKSFAKDENRKIILQEIEKIGNFEEFSKLKELPENSSQFLKDLLNKLKSEEQPKKTQSKSSPFELAVKRLEFHKTLSRDIEEIDDFCKFSDLEKLPDYCSEFLDDVFKDFDKDVIKKVDKKKPLFKTGFMMFVECLQSDESIDKEKVSEVLNNYWIDLKGHYEQLKSYGILSAKNLEACFVTGTAIKQLMKPKPNKGDTNETKMILDWIPVLTGSSLRNFIVHNNHLLLLLPYNYEILLKKNCEVLFKEEENCSLTSNLNFDDWINFINGLDLQPTPALENAGDLNTLIKFGSIEELKEYQLINPDLNIQPDNLKYAIIRGNEEIFRTVLQWNGLGTIIENPLNAKNYTPFLLCCELGESEFVKLLIEKNCNVFAKSGFGYSCFHIAAQRNHDKLFGDLLGLQLRLNITIVPIYQFLNETPFKFKPHHVAFQNNSVDVLRLIQQKANDGDSVINQSLTLKMDSKDVVVDSDWKRKLININRKIQFKIKETTWINTSYQINGEYEKECNLTSEEQPIKIDSFWKIPKSNFLHKVVESGYLTSLHEFNDILEPETDEETLFKLIEFQYTPEVFAKYFTIYKDQKRKKNATLDDKIAEVTSDDMVSTLDNIATKKNWSLLYTAVKYNNVPMIEYLDREMNSEKWKTKTNEGITPLHLLFELKRDDYVKKLLDSKPNKEPTSLFKNLKQDHTAKSTVRSLLHWIVLNRWDFCIQNIPKDELLFIINDADCFGETPLNYANNTNNTKMVEKLEKLIEEVTKRAKLDDC